MTKTGHWTPEEILNEILPRKLKTPQAFDLVYGQLREMILKGKLRKGQRLFQEEIKRMFGVSVAVVSKVYDQLQKEGLIVKKGKAGTLVCGVQEGRGDYHVFPGIELVV
jgi:DNA-binding GntR family transcriptional regulator